MKILKYILDMFIGKSVDGQEQDYIQRYGYPDESVVFTDSRGRMSQLIGKNTFLKAIEQAERVIKFPRKIINKQ